MTTLAARDFGEFFAAVHGGARPFRWQVRLVDQLLAEGRWPEQVGAPTGSGKTAVIDAHVFAVAAMADGVGAVVPRRLALVVPRRVLVDSQYDHACHVARMLAGDCHAQSEVVQKVAGALRSMRWGQAPQLGPAPGSALVVARLRGGLPVPRAWRDDPVACGVLTATPDMWGSRLLLRGYGSSSRTWPREAGLLATDAVVVIDEAHLCRQLLVTARSVAALERRAEAALGVPSLQVVAATATPDANEGSVVGVGPGDLGEEVLAQRLVTPKPVDVVRLAEWPAIAKGPSRAAVVGRIVAEALALRQEFGPTVGVFVNSVRLATDVARELRLAYLDGDRLGVELLCGRLRHHDVERLEVDRPGLLGLAGNEGVDVLVATQSLEVGVDIDLSAAVSELAPGGALAQRAGRVNRLGQRKATRLVVVGPDDASRLSSDAASTRRTPREWGPYEPEDLARALRWLEQRASDPAGVSPWALVSDPPSPATARRRLYQRVELADSWWWARSSDDLDPEPELDLWLADDLKSPEAEGGVVVRHALPNEPDQAVALLQALRPREHEVFPAPIADIRKLVARALRSETDWGTVVVVQGDEVRVVDSQVGVADSEDGSVLRPGDIVVLDDKATAFTSGVVDPCGEEAMDDVSESRPSPGPGDVALRVDVATWGERAEALLEAYEALLANGGTTRQAYDGLAEMLDEIADQRPMPAAAAALLRGPLKASDVVPFYEDDRLVRLAVVDQRAAVSDDGCRQTWTPATEPVTLERHALGVAERARLIAECVGLAPGLVGLLGLAGRHHDDGKADPRFQAVLGGGSDGPLLAKSQQATSTRRRPPSALPARWRHEQLSALHALDALDDLDDSDRDLVVRLVGTSHGHGRSSFPHVSAELGVGEDRQEAAAMLFDEGSWDEIIERTDRRFGVWGSAYLEALLRAADGQVSGEGS